MSRPIHNFAAIAAAARVYRLDDTALSWTRLIFFNSAIAGGAAG